jgi:hypothetical protein
VAAAFYQPSGRWTRTRYTGLVDPRHLRAYAARPWNLVAARKRAFWANARQDRGVLATFEASQALWVHMRRVRPDWPSAAERQADRAHHVALKRALDRAASALGGSAGR